MKVRLIIVFCLLLTGLLHFNSVASPSPDKEFDKANVHYRSGEYDEAIKTYEQLIKSGYRSPAVFYNLGNAYYKKEDIARAIVNYERALKLSPQDEDILFNLRLANLNTVDKIEPLPQLFYQQWWNQFITRLSVDQWSRLGIIAFWIAAVFGVLYIFGNRIWMKKSGFFGGVLFIICGIFLLYAARMQHERVEGRKSAVIIESSAYVKSSPDDKSVNLFMLHAGTKIDVLDELRGWKKIKIANGNIGWINYSLIEVI